MILYRYNKSFGKQIYPERKSIMKKLSKKISFAVALAMLSTFTACSGDNAESGGEAAVPTATSETTTATMGSEDADVVDQVEMDAEKLENGTLKWLSFWSLEPQDGESVDVFLQLFKTKYGGEIQYIQTTTETKYDDLANLVLGGNAPDMFPAADLDTFPGRVANGMFQPMDEYIDFSSDLFPEGASKINDMHTIGGKHYMACVAADVGTIVLYNKNTIEQNGLDDPAELVYNNEWTWGAFKKMCEEFADRENDQFAIDGWWFEKALLLSTGVPIIGMEDGVIKNNMMDPNIARAEEFFLEIHNGDLNFPRAEYEWKEHPERIGEGKTLFYPVGTWQLYEPTISNYGNPGEIMFVPMPRDEQADAWYQSVEGGLDAYAMCKGAPNPDAVAAFIQCKLTANTDESVKEINKKQLVEDYGWTDEMVEMFDYASEITNANPIVDFYQGLNKDAYDLIHNPIKDASYNGTDWYTTRETYNGAVQKIVDEMNTTLQELDQ